MRKLLVLLLLTATTALASCRDHEVDYSAIWPIKGTTGCELVAGMPDQVNLVSASEQMKNTAVFLGYNLDRVSVTKMGVDDVCDPAYLISVAFNGQQVPIGVFGAKHIGESVYLLRGKIVIVEKEPKETDIRILMKLRPDGPTLFNDLSAEESRGFQRYQLDRQFQDTAADAIQPDNPFAAIGQSERETAYRSAIEKLEQMQESELIPYRFQTSAEVIDFVRFAEQRTYGDKETPPQAFTFAP